MFAEQSLEGIERIGATQTALQVRAISSALCPPFLGLCVSPRRRRGEEEEISESRTHSSSLLWTTSALRQRGLSLARWPAEDCERRTVNSGPLEGYASLSLPSSFPLLSLLSPSLSLSLSRVNHVTMYPLGQDPIKQPLLKKLLSHNDELQQKAVTSFLDILAYSCILLHSLVYSSKLAVLSLTAVHRC